ncbi:hypothetical protein SG34_009085 [Thalassomonas viridans]|uniref:Uncharacterized protein n=1 Tax=Thalassomonas viridans TaxID=137584 RepID=A0AAF0CC02_9GAMM|nr:hypothetical protein [Thalassomonas viridans]WDE07019.1 hypothetical protein SG34_009085 [Thalassomonas viridans]
MENSIFTPQKHVVFTFGAISDAPFIGTTGMAPCVGFAVYHKASRSAAACHFDSDGVGTGKFDAYEVGCAVLDRFKKGIGQNITKACIVLGSGPDETSDALVSYLADACEDKGVTAEYYRAGMGDWGIQTSTGKMFGCAVPGIDYNGDKDKLNFKTIAMRSKGSPDKVVISRLEKPLTPTLKFKPWNQL